MEERITNLEDFQKKWKFYFWAALVIAGLFAAFFGFKIINLSGKLSELTNDISEKEDRIIELEGKLENAGVSLDKTILKAGDITAAIEETRKASIDAREAAREAESASKKSQTESNKAYNAAKKAEAIARTVDERLHRFEKIIVDLQEKNTSKTDKQSIKSSSEEQDKLFVKVNGSNIDLRFEEGSNPYKDVNIVQANYSGIIYVPNKRMAIVTGATSNSKFIVAKELKGRVINNMSGANNSWVQE